MMENNEDKKLQFEGTAFPAYKGLVPLRQTGNLIFLSGRGPEDVNTYGTLYRGRIGEDLTLAEGRKAAAECAKILLHAIKVQYGTLDCIKQVVRALALVNCQSGFTETEQVADGFSDLMVQVLEERGKHARTVMGTRNMPNYNIPVEIELIVELKEEYCRKEKEE